MSKTSAQIFPKSKTMLLSLNTRPNSIRSNRYHCPMATLTLFFCPSPLPFGGSTVLSLTRDQRGIEPSPAVCQRHKSAATPTSTTRTTVNGNSHTIGSNNEDDTPDKRIHRTLPNIHNDWQRNKIYTILPEQQRTYIDMCRVI